jgi:hypothetical protein
MATVSRGLPEQPHLDIPRREARELLDQWRAAQPAAFARIRQRHPKFAQHDDAALAAATFRLADAQLVIAREYGLTNWPTLKRRIESHGLAGALQDAIERNEVETVVRILRAHPPLLHVPVWSGNWGPPMSHAANLGRLEIIQSVAALGAQDFQHAFDRALLQGQIETARWLHAHGAKLAPGIVMGACETLNPDGLRFLAELGAPFTNEHGNRLAPVSLVLGTYCRNPAGKHAVLDLLARQGYDFPDTPILAFHRGQVDGLREHLQRDPTLANRPFSRREIYPPELGCADHDLAGMCGTPIHGGTLLHLAVDFNEQEIFDLLLAQGADVNARAAIDAEGWGGHTPLFNAVVNCGIPTSHAADMTRTLLARGASTTLRANVRKFLDWCEKPRWHEAPNVTPADWARTFPEPRWVNPEALHLVDSS